MTAEGRYHRHIRLHREGLAFEMATGLFRLAATTGAIVIPCLIAAGPRMTFTIHLGEPVPDDLVIGAHLHRAGCDHLLGEFLPILGRHLGQSHALLVDHLCPGADAAGHGRVPRSGTLNREEFPVNRE